MRVFCLFSLHEAFTEGKNKKTCLQNSGNVVYYIYIEQIFT